MNNYMGGRGVIVVRLTHMEGRLLLAGATVELLNRGERYTTDKNGTVRMTVPAPAKSLSLSPNPSVRPYGVYDLRITLAGYVPITVYGVQVFEGIESLCRYNMVRTDDSTVAEDVIPLPPHGRFGFGTAAQSPRGAVAAFATESVRPVVVPENIRVHLGQPGSDAVDVTVPFIDYVKSVACSEIYPTWPDEALTANINAEVTLVLNRIYTEWYPSQGYDFDISASPAFDQYYVHRRDIFDNVEAIVDRIFNTYIARRGFLEPIYAQFCDGAKSACSGLSQWGSVTLAEQGYSADEIVRYYYGQDVETREAQVVESDPDSYPGTPLGAGSAGADVLTVQNRLNRIAINYPAIPFITLPEGVYDNATERAVTVFRQIFGLPEGNTVDEDTWYRILYIYNAVKRLAELESEGEELQGGAYPGNDLVLGDRGPNVLRMEWFINAISRSGQFPQVPTLTLNGIYDSETATAVRVLQGLLGLNQSGTVDKATWDGITKLYNQVGEAANPPLGGGSARPYPGAPLKRGDRGENVFYIQERLNVISRYNSAVPPLETDGIFGVNTRDAVYAFQREYGLEVDGIVGPLTWEKLNSVYATAEAELPAMG